jgi:hypothetical protein
VCAEGAPVSECCWCIHAVDGEADSRTAFHALFSVALPASFPCASSECNGFIFIWSTAYSMRWAKIAYFAEKVPFARLGPTLMSPGAILLQLDAVYSWVTNGMVRRL